MDLTAEAFAAKLLALATEEERLKFNRYFGEGHDFAGVRMGAVFDLAKAHIGMPLGEIEKLMESDVHELRAGACSIMDKQARKQPSQALYELYLRRHDRINNWDLVDLAAPHVVGAWLFDKPRDKLYQLAVSSNWCERRTAIYATFYFQRKGQIDDTLALAAMLIKDPEDLVNKAVGTMLRCTGDNDQARLLAFLDQHVAGMPRACLSYATEKLSLELRKQFSARARGSSRSG